MPVYIFFQIWAAASLMMVCGWLFAVYRNRGEIVDVLWAAGTGLAGVWCAYSLDGDLQRRIVLAVLSAIWGTRLAFHLFKDRVMALKEDGRYEDLRNSWGAQTNKNLFLFFQLQAFLIVFLASAFFAVATNSRSLEWYDLLSIVVAIVSLTGEAISDKQLKDFKQALPEGSKQICKVGLWSWSRHPNYFFEWLYWLSFIPLAYGGSLFWLVFISPALIFYLIRYVTGIPPAENRMLASRGAEFKQYQSEVSAFFLLPPRK